MSIQYRPLFGRVIIKREKLEKTKGGIFIPDTQTKRQARSEGIIIAMGPTAGFVTVNNGEEKTIQTLKVGDKVIFGRHAGTWLDSTYTESAEKDDGTTFICQDEDILAVIEEV